MDRPRHPDKHIEKAVHYAESLGWRFEKSGPRAHAWGRLYWPRSTREGCIIRVWSTPKVHQNHARHIMRDVDLCPHGPAQSTDAGKGEDDESRE